MLQNWRHLAQRPIFSVCRVSAGARSHRHEGPFPPGLTSSWPGRAGGARSYSEQRTLAGLDKAGAAGRWASSRGSQGLEHKAAPDQPPSGGRGPREPCTGSPSVSVQTPPSQVREPVTDRPCAGGRCVWSPCYSGVAPSCCLQVLCLCETQS